VASPLDAIDAATVGRLLSAALGSGGDYADLYFEYRSGADFSFEEGRVRTVGRGVILGLGVRVAIASSKGIARVVTRARELAVVAQGRERAFLAPLPATVLEDERPIAERDRVGARRSRDVDAGRVHSGGSQLPAFQLSVLATKKRW